MMLRARRACLIAIVAFLAGCAAPATPTVNLGAPFDAADARRLLVPGVNTIRGSAFLRQQGGGVVTCAGSDVSLVPATAYAKRIYQALYGTDQGQARHKGERFTVTPQSDEFGQLVKKTQCDAQGYFTFDRVADGDFFVETTVAWMVAGVKNGGPIMRRVTVAGGSTAAIVIAP